MWEDEYITQEKRMFDRIEQMSLIDYVEYILVLLLPSDKQYKLLYKIIYHQ